MAQHQIVAVAAGRGGSAKTTLTFAMGDVLHRLRGMADVALLDLDPQANLTSYAGQDPVDDPLRADAVEVYGLSLYRGGRGLALADVQGRAAHVARVLAEGSPDRVVIADLPPALHDPSHRVLFERDDVFWVGAIRAEPGSFQSLNELVAMCARARAPYVLVPTFYIGNRSVIAATSMALRSQHAGHVAKTVLPDDSKAKECVLAGMPVTLFAPRAKASQAVVALMEEVFGDGDPDDVGASGPGVVGQPGADAGAAGSSDVRKPSSKGSAKPSAADAAAPGAAKRRATKVATVAGSPARPR
jgi:chromosome partitioning protein